MADSAHPETATFAEKLSALCTSGPTFRNLDVVCVDTEIRRELAWP
jgi:hypothetical protein